MADVECEGVGLPTYPRGEDGAVCSHCGQPVEVVEPERYALSHRRPAPSVGAPETETEEPPPSYRTGAAD